MAWLPDGEKFRRYLFVSAQLTNVTDRRTLGDGIYRAYAYASRGKNCAVGMLKLTTDKHEASRGLSATPELLVFLSIRRWLEPWRA